MKHLIERVLEIQEEDSGSLSGPGQEVSSDLEGLLKSLQPRLGYSDVVVVDQTQLLGWNKRVCSMEITSRGWRLTLMRSTCLG